MSLMALLGYAGVALVTMIPLRALSMLCNAIFITIGYTGHVYSSVRLINAYRLWEMIRLTRRVEAASRGNETMDWLKPFMSRRRYRKGEFWASSACSRRAGCGRKRWNTSRTRRCWSPPIRM